MTFLPPLLLLKIMTVVILLLGIIVYSVFIVGIYFFGRWQETKQTLESMPNLAFGLPFSAVASFGIVSLLVEATPSSGTQLEFKAFNLAFTGPAGPVTLWVLCFTAFVMAIKTLSK